MKRSTLLLAPGFAAGTAANGEPADDPRLAQEPIHFAETHMNTGRIPNPAN